jgi:TPP-dependent pyruvate/acetoin dehydrogenase alpha subunit
MVMTSRLSHDARRAFDAIRLEEGPYLLECMTYRIREHVGPNFDHDVGRNYRTQEEVKKWILKCPITTTRNVLKNVYKFDDALLESIRENVITEIDSEFRLASNSDFPDLSSIFDNLYGLKSQIN